jgi:hypothetical protein
MNARVLSRFQLVPSFTTDLTCRPAQERDRGPQDQQVRSQCLEHGGALDQPNRRNDGKSEKTVTIKSHASTTEVRVVTELVAVIVGL